MDVIVIESNAYKHLVKRLENIEMMMLDNTKLIKASGVQEEPAPKEFITREQASEDFQISLTTVDKKIKKFGVSRLPSGGKKLLNRLEFIKALQQPDPFQKVFNRKKGGDRKT